MPLIRKIIIATGNAHKLREFADIFAGYEVSCMPAGIELPPETGVTFYENARIKAWGLWQQLKERDEASAAWVLADDSGIEVEALGGSPGVFSARYAGEGASDGDNVAKLLAELEGQDNRDARFVCELVGFSPEGQELRATGALDGRIADEPQGGQGFGYDPIFIPTGYELRVSQLDPAEKNRISHRGRAAQAWLEQLLAAETA